MASTAPGTSAGVRSEMEITESSIVTAFPQQEFESGRAGSMVSWSEILNCQLPPATGSIPLPTICQCRKSRCVTIVES